ncbi:monooxygenase [Roseomonas sp. KE2513]|uniref:FAD-dependent oxidoreductase n=1 Tax=Roseomonas sp. KE2513 TaxID=2479202 RepID=UPI0018DFFCCA|nr:FAD-dependent oxidoreductase [Roseomonas sp. KE2513]MBI0539027.1 monooxygenase [Roseomonas sp. KE2513]
MTTFSTPVAIVGGGPVGLMLALFLDRYGVRCVVFNAEASVRHHPKGSTHNARTMEHYRRLGFADRIRALGLPSDHPTDVAYFTRFNGWELARLRFPSEKEKLAARTKSAATDQTPEPIHRANQMYVEAALFEQAASRPNITLRFGTSVESFEQDACGVTFRVRAASGQPEEAWQSSYLVGCDGGRSTVRRALGIQYVGYEALKQAFFGGRMVSTHIRAPNLYRDVLGTRRAWQYWVVNPELRTAMVPLNGRDEFLLWTRGDPEDTNTPAVAEVLRQCAGMPVEVEVLDSSPWTAGVALHADRFGEGRVLLAGDAVHLFTPTGGFGMNTGVEDAANLAWKLAAMVQGWGGPGLLNSYEVERKAIAIRNTAAARELARSVGEVKVPPELEHATAEGEAARAEVGRFLATFGEEFASLGVQLGARYDGSPIILPDGQPPVDDLVSYVPSSVPGGRAPHFWLDAGRGPGSSLFDRFGIGFTLLRLGPDAPDVDAFVTGATALGIPLTELAISDPAARDLYGCDLALVRPDQHIAWRGSQVPAEVEAILAKVVGHDAAVAQHRSDGSKAA